MYIFMYVCMQVRMYDNDNIYYNDNIYVFIILIFIIGDFKIFPTMHLRQLNFDILSF